MPLPSDLSTKVLHAQYVRYDGAYAAGNVTLSGSFAMRSAAQNMIVIPSAFQLTLNATGEFSVTLPASNDPDLVPAGWSYHVVESFVGFTREYDIEIPYDGPATIELADLSPVASIVDVTRYVQYGELGTEINNSELAGRVTVVETDVTAATSSNTAGTLMRRDGAGRARVQDPSNAYDIATKQYADSLGAIVATPSTVMRRDAAGRAQIVSPSVSADIANKGYVDTADGLRALDTAVVHLAGTETISGSKTFSVIPQTSVAPSSANHLTNYAFVTGLDAASAHIAGTETFTGSKIFSAGLTASAFEQHTPTARTGAVTLTTTSPYNNPCSAAAAYTITLPATTTAGIRFLFRKTDATAFAITIAGTIDGLTNYVLASLGDYVEVESTTTSGVWNTTGRSRAKNSPFTQPYAASVTPNAQNGNIQRITMTGAMTLNGPTQPQDGQQIEFQLTQDGTGGRVLTLATGAGNFSLPSDIASIVLSLTAARMDRLTAEYRLSSNRWEITGFVRGYA